MMTLKRILALEQFLTLKRGTAHPETTCLAKEVFRQRQSFVHRTEELTVEKLCPFIHPGHVYHNTNSKLSLR